ncbi:hypothetical protein AB0I84_22650 [Streptomyces spectabilis]|uniref:hypothetical protein n=1 Tax=Streptomyces spectabilis TaxID=68270 RepID=UPI0033C809EB
MRLPRRGGRPRTLSIHVRLFLGFGGALVVCSALMAAVIYVGIRFVPTYDLTTPIEVPSPRPSGSTSEPQWAEPHALHPTGTP